MESFLRRLNKSSNIRNLRPVNFFHKSSFPNYYLHTKSSANFSVSFPFSLQYNSQKIVNNSFSNPTKVPKQNFSHKKITKDFSNLNNKSHFSTKNKVQEINGVLTKKVISISEKIQNDTKNLSHAHHQHKIDQSIDKDNKTIQNETLIEKSLNRDEHQIREAIISSHEKIRISSTPEDLGTKQSSASNTKKRKTRPEHMREQKVPTTSFSRALGFAGLGLSLAASAVTSSVKNVFSSDKTSVVDSIGSEYNAEKITQTLCRMRGVPLKLGQALSMQEEYLIPKPISEALARAQKSADILPQSQLNQMLESELGTSWRSHFKDFESKPIAAASIGQVHRACTKEGVDVAVKVQYPGVAESIDSDLNNLKVILGYTKILPTSFFFGDLIRNMRTELKEECNYLNEATKQMEFRELLKGLPGFYVPKVIPHLSTRHVLTSEWVDGLSIEECVQNLNQEQRDRLGSLISTLTWTQLFKLRYMQTDPNPANYFYDHEKDLLYLIDYGAAKKFSKEFVQSYMEMLHASINNDRDKIIDSSIKLGILTGEEGKDMIEAHVHAVTMVGEPFRHDGLFDFGNQDLTTRIYEKMPEIIQKRLKSPPLEVFALHRLLGGVFLMCMKLRSVVPMRRIFEDIYYQVNEGGK